MTLNCIVIEDEPPAMDLIGSFINRTPFLNLIGCYFDASEGLQFVNNHQIDLIFLDIRMPDLSGIELARKMSKNIFNVQPAIIFTTAFDQFAVEGYRLDAVDYLLKPFEYEEFLKASEKAVRFNKYKSVDPVIRIKDDGFLSVKVGHAISKIPYGDIASIEGMKDYAQLNLINPDRKVLSLITLKALEEKLPANLFIRIHKSTIISVEKISSLTRSSVCVSGKVYPVSDSYKEQFGMLVDKWRLPI